MQLHIFSPELSHVLAVAAPGVCPQTDLDKVGAVHEGEVARIAVEPVVVQGQHLQWLQVAKRLVLDIVEEVPVKVELSQSCK